MSTDITEQTITIGPFPPTTFAMGAIEGLPEAVRSTAGEPPNVLVVTDRGLKGSPLIERIVALLREAGIPAETFAEVHPNPTTGDLDAGGRAARGLGAG